jgi:hypothetical protein
MSLISDESHPCDGPISLARLPAFIAQADNEEFKSTSKLKGLRDGRKAALRAQLFWYNIDHTERMLLPTLEKLLRQALETKKVCYGTSHFGWTK